jgi:uncharacterized protein YegL
MFPGEGKGSGAPVKPGKEKGTSPSKGKSVGGLEGGSEEPETSDTQLDGPVRFDWSEAYRSHPDLKDTNPETSPLSPRDLKRSLKAVSRRVLADSMKDAFRVPDFGSDALGDIGSEVKLKGRVNETFFIDDQTVNVTQAGETTTLSRQVVEEAKGLYPIIRQSLRRLLLARRANRHRTECEDGELDPGTLYALAIRNGPRNVFSQISRGRAVNTSALLLIDGSSSMGGRKAQTVMRCAYFFASCLEKCSVATEVAVFQNSSPYGDRDVDYMVVKAFEERLKKAASRFNPVATGGTPMAEAMMEAVRRITSRREPRKLLFVLTDGCPHNRFGDARAFMVRLADFAQMMYGLETVGLGVDTSAAVALCFRDFVMLDNTSSRTVGQDFISVMQRKVLEK